MRAAHRRRPRKDERLSAGSQINLTEMAEEVSYIISSEHKDYLTSAGPRNLRSDASACPRNLNFDEVEEWLRSAVRERTVSAALEGGFPRYVWTRVEGQVYEARLSNSGLGQYKGYPIENYEAPGWLQ